ncbi:hypothetical protein WA158_006420 [Blastocystis sp. Blastoise]
METQAVTLIKSELNLDRDEWHYYTNIKIGSQESPARMMIDTTFSYSYVYAKICAGIYHVSTNPYDKNNSTTVSPISCGDSLCQIGTCHNNGCRGTCHPLTSACCSKADSSLCAFNIFLGQFLITEGSLIRDNIMFQTTTGYSQSFPTTFGYLDYTTLYTSDRDGVLGLGYKHRDCKFHCVNTYMDDMVDNINGVTDMFTICFGNNQGVLTYGGIDTDLYSGSITWVHFVVPSNYTVELNDFRVNDVNFFKPNQTMFAVFNSYIHWIVLQSDLYDALVTLFKTRYCHLPGVCDENDIFEYCLPDRPSSSEWPTIDIYLNGVHLTLSSNLYFLYVVRNDVSMYCFVITRDNKGLNYSTFGPTFMRGFTLIYDREHDRIGFATPTNDCHSIYILFKPFLNNSFSYFNKNYQIFNIYIHLADAVGGIHVIAPPPTPPPTPSPTSTPTSSPSPIPSPTPVDDSTDTLVIILISCSVVVVVICGVIIIVTCHSYHSIQRIPIEDSRPDHKSLDTSKQSSNSQELQTIHTNQQTDSIVVKTTL